MDWLKRLTGKTVALDTAPLIYFVEENPYFLGCVRPLFQALEQGTFTALTSTLTITETLVKPLQLGQVDRAHTFRVVLAEYMDIVPVTAEIAEVAAKLRADHNLRTPDAIQIATSITCRADFFITNDARLGRLQQPEVLVLTDLKD
ncbi:type II toxin-antitoxin system VapC family toxin [Deltaproteobacteria bacterium OttesenSCG-928-K17]|nr:type II toxin-antitoxin system VapC family toxin [Deltaproteobacteria bacterium OttesenSCG-928-K17]